MATKCPVGYTCPDIDKAIKELDTVAKYVGNALLLLEDARNREVDIPEGMRDELRNAFEQLESAADELNSWDLEPLRNQNEALREWGGGLAKELEQAEDEIRSLKDQINDLENQCDSYKHDIQHLEAQLG